jgi:N-acyl homoserine lactone hydrolase
MSEKTALSGGDHSVWTLCFAKGQLPRDFVEGSPVASNGGTVPIPMIYSVIASHAEGRRKIFLVDTGFSSGASMTGRRFADVETPAETLRKVDLTPADVDTILLTHLHFDHAGNLDAFPNATILVQASEYEGWRHVLSRLGDAPTTKQSWILSSMNPNDVRTLERAVSDGRVTFVDGSHDVVPGVSLKLAADTHTFGSQWVEIATPTGPVVLAGDSVVTYANLERMWPPGYHQGNAWRLIETYEHLKDLVGPDRLERIVVGHDMQIFERHKSWVAGGNPVAEIAVAAIDASRSAMA